MNKRKNIGVSWNNSILMRITVTFVAILMPLYLLGIFIYDSALKSVHKEITSSMVEQVSFYMNGLEKEIQRSQLLLYGMINDIYLNRLAMIPAALNTIDKTQAIWSLQNRVEAISSSSLYISGLTVYIPSIERTVTDSSVEKIDMKRYLALAGQYSPEDMICYIDGAPSILVESPFIDNATGAPIYLMVIRLNRQAFADALSQFDKYPGSGSFLVSAKSGQNVARVNMPADIESMIIGNISQGGQGNFQIQDKNKRVNGTCVYVASEALGMTLSIYVPEDVVYQPIKKYQIWFYIFSLAAAVVIAAFSFSMYRFIHKPLMHLVNAFKQMEDGDLQLTIEHHHKDEFRYLYTRFNEMVEKLGNLIKQVYTMKILTQKAELKQLQSQINPHFLYNSFFILHRRIKGGDYENAMAFSQQLGNYFRFITRSAEDDVPLMREVEHARIYADIQRMRFSSRISVDFGELPDDCRQMSVPRLLLQPIIENAFEHGLENKVSGGMLRIGFALRESALSIVVEDNGEALEDADLARMQALLAGAEGPAESTGIVNIHKRMQLRFGEASGVQVSRSELGGLRVELRIRQ